MTYGYLPRRSAYLSAPRDSQTQNDCRRHVTRTYGYLPNRSAYLSATLPSQLQGTAKFILFCVLPKVASRFLRSSARGWSL